MRILIDGTCLAGNLAGIGKTTFYLLQQLLSQNSHEYHIYFNLDQKDSERIMAQLNLTSMKLFGTKRHYGFFTSKHIDRVINNVLLKQIDVVHFPNYEAQSAIRKGCNVVSVYDLSAEVFPHFFTDPMRDFVQIRGREAAQQARRLIVCSESTRRDLMQHWGIPESRIDVVYLAPGLHTGQHEDVEGGLPERYILFVGTLEPRKNVERIVGAFNALKKEGAPHRLVLIGQKGWLSDGIFNSIENSPYRTDIIWKQYLPEAQLVSAYTGAEVLLYPSHYEGFGMPVAEAMSVGMPVITSNVSSLPEVGGDAPLYVNPNEPDDIFDALRRVTSSAELRADMKQKGLQQASRFSWARTAAATIAAYEKSLAPT